MKLDTEKMFAIMNTIYFDSETDTSAFLSEYFPLLLIKKLDNACDVFFKEYTWKSLEKAMQGLQQDKKKHSLFEVYACIENDKEEDDRLRLCVLSTVRTNLSKDLIAASVSGR